MYDFRLFADCQPRLSESPVWCDRDQMLYWRGLDGEIFRKGMDTGVSDYEVFHPGLGNIGSIMVIDDGFLLFGDGGRIWNWAPDRTPQLVHDFGLSTFNDCISDPFGRIYCGVLTENYFDEARRGRYGSFWCLHPDGRMVCIDDRTGNTPNGIRLSPGLDTLYFAVTDHNCVYAYDYDPATGDLSNRRILLDDCCPDGIDVDGHGNIWITDCRCGGPLLCVSPSGVILETYTFPVRRITSVAFGGPDRRTLFVTTAHENQPVGLHDGGLWSARPTANS